MKNEVVLLVHSLPAYGGAGLSVMLPLLGTRVCPVPSVLLTATADFAGHCRWPQADLVEVLRAHVEFHLGSGRRPHLFVGYLNDAEQVRGLAQWLPSQRSELGQFWMDPICGDQGRAYATAETIEELARLAATADVLLPNSTEVHLLAEVSGCRPEDWLATRQTHAHVIVTSANADQRYGISWYPSGESRSVFYPRPQLPRARRGTGDVFAAALLRKRLDGREWSNALREAAQTVEDLLARAERCHACVLPVP